MESWAVMYRHLASLALMLALLVAPARGVAPDPLLPDDAEMVLAVNVRSLAQAPFFRAYIHDLTKDFLTKAEPLSRVCQALGIDPLADVDSLVFAGPASLAGERYAIILRGKFAPEKIHAAATAWMRENPTAMQVHKQDGRAVYEFKTNLAGLFACLLDDSTLVLARPRTYLDEAIARKDGKRKPALNKELAKLLGLMDAQQTIWLAATVSPGLKKELATSADTEKIFATVSHVHGGVTIGEDCGMRLLVQTRDPKFAAELRQFADGVKAILSLAAMDHKSHAPLLTALVAGLQAGSGADGVTISGKTTKEQVEKAVKEKAKP